MMTFCDPGNVRFLLDRVALSEGHTVPLDYNPAKSCHFYIGGASGAGKTVAGMGLMAKLTMSRPNLKAWVVDYKGDDALSELEETDGARYWSHKDALDGLDEFYGLFQSRLYGDKDRSPRWLWVDELAAMVLSLPKKDAEAVKAKVSALLMMGRSMGCQLLLTMQRNDASFFSGGAKLNIGNILILGNPSSTEAQMLDLDRSKLVPVHDVGGGHLIVNGGDPIPAQVPLVRYPDIMFDALKLAATR